MSRGERERGGEERPEDIILLTLSWKKETKTEESGLFLEAGKGREIDYLGASRGNVDLPTA